MSPPSVPALYERIRLLPAAGPLLDALGGATGVHLVGGAVRDLLLGGAPLDLDLVVEGDAAAVARALGGEVRIHDRFGTSTVKLDRFTYDIARSRTETYERPGALPDVSPAPLAEDLKRRDFTVNAIAVTLGGPRPGELSSAPAAFEDLAARRLRVLRDRSFIDDPTRLLRLARYASRLGFVIEQHTLALARAAVDDGALATVSGPRIGAELRLLAREPDPLNALASLHELGVDAAIDPGLGAPDVELGRRALALLPRDGRRDLVALALAARGVPAPRLTALLDQLAFEAADREAIVAAATRAEAVAGALSRARSPSEIAAAAGDAGPELIAIAGALGPADPARRWLEELRHVRLEIDGRDLLAAGVPQGPAVGRGLRAALAAKLDGQLDGREHELAAAVQAALGPG